MYVQSHRSQHPGIPASPDWIFSLGWLGNDLSGSAPEQADSREKLHNQGWWCNNTLEQWYFPQRVKYRSERKWHQRQGRKKTSEKEKEGQPLSGRGTWYLSTKQRDRYRWEKGRGFCDCGRPRVNVHTAPHQREPSPLLLADFIGLACRTDGANSYTCIYCHVKERHIWFRYKIERYYGYNVYLTFYVSTGM